MRPNFKKAIVVAVVMITATTVAAQTVSAARSRVGASQLTTAADAAIDNFRVSSDGEWAVFSSEASNLVAGDTNEASDVFALKLDTGDVTRLSVYADGSETLIGNNSLNPAVCGDGSIVAFQTQEDFDFEADFNSAQDVYWVNRDADGDGIYDEFDQDGAVTVRRASIGTNFDEVYDSAQNAAISQDCSWISYDTSDTLESDDINVEVDVYAHSTVDDTNVLISKSLKVGGTGGGGELSTISATGRYITYVSIGTDLVEASGGKIGVVRVDRDSDGDSVMDEADAVTRIYISQNTAGVASNGQPDRSAPPVMTPDGSCVAFKSVNASDLDDSAITNNGVYLRDVEAGTTQIISESDGLAAVEVANPAISSDCRFVTFDSGDTDFLLGDTNGKRDVFLRDVNLGHTVMVSLGTDGTESIDDSTSAVVLPMASGQVPVYILSRSSAAGSIPAADYARPIRIDVAELTDNALSVRAGSGTTSLTTGSFVTAATLNMRQTASGILGTTTLKVQKAVATAKAALGSWTDEKSVSIAPTNGIFAPQTKSGIAIAAGQTLCMRSRITVGLIDDIGTSICVARPLAMSSPLITKSTGTLAWKASGTALTTKAKNAVLTLNNISGRKFALVATRCNGCGTIQVKLGARTVNVNLQATRTQANVLIPVNFTGITNNVAGTLTIKVTTTNKSVTINGIGIARY